MKVSPHDPFNSQRIAMPPVTLDGPVDGRLLHVHAHVDRYPPFVNAGAEWMLHAMMRHLAEQGHTATVATDIDEPAIVDGVHVWPATFRDDLANDCDVMVSHLLWTDRAVRLAHRHAKPLLYIVHNDTQVGYWKLDPSTVSAVVWNSEWVAAAHRWDGPSIVCRPPTMLRDYELDRDPADAEHITLVNPNAEKGARLFYELARAHPHRRFLVVGGAYGIQHQPPRDLRNVDFQPATGNMVGDVYKRTRIVLVPSKYESWGRVATEAMCSGIPVLAHPTPGLLESLGDAGIFCNRLKLSEWSAALDLLDDPATYADRSAMCRARALVLDQLARADLDRWAYVVARAGMRE